MVPPFPCHTTGHAGPHPAVRFVEVLVVEETFGVGGLVPAVGPAGATRRRTVGPFAIHKAKPRNFLVVARAAALFSSFTFRRRRSWSWRSPAITRSPAFIDRT